MFKSHPVEDLLQEAVKTVHDELYHFIYDYEYEGHGFCYADNMSFAEYLFAYRLRMKQYKRILDDRMAGRMDYDEDYSKNQHIHSICNWTS